MNNIKDILTEWFAHLPKGYAQPPYTTSELSILKRVMINNQYSQNDANKAISLMENEKDLDNDGKNDDSPTDRFIADSAEFMESVESFEDYVFNNYVMDGQQISNLDILYDKIRLMPDNVRKPVIKILAKNTKRNLENGSYKMGQYEKALFDAIAGSVKVPNGHHSELWFAFIHDGAIKGGVAGESGIVSDVDVEDDSVSLKNYASIRSVDFGSLNPALSKTFRNIISLTSILLGQQITKSIGRVGINKLIQELEKPEISEDFNKLIELSKTTEIKMIQKIGDKLGSLMGVGDPKDYPGLFCAQVDELISTKINEVSYWGVISGDMVHLEDSLSIFEKIRCKNNRLSDAVLNFKGLHLWVNAKKIHEEIVD